MPDKQVPPVIWLEYIKNFLKTPLGILISGCGILFLLAGAFLLTTPQQNETISTTSLIVDAFVKLFIVILLIYISAYWVKSWRVGIFNRAPRQLTILETLALSPRRALYLIQVGKQSLLIGATDQSVQLITKIPSQNDDASMAHVPDQQFASILSQSLQQDQIHSQTTPGIDYNQRGS